MPGVWSTILALPLIGAGLYTHYGDTTLPSFIGLATIAFGIFILIAGWYVHVVAPPQPQIQPSEQLVDVRHPSQRVALVTVLTGAPIFLAGLYLFYFTRVPYIYPTITFLGGVYLFSTGLRRYWLNTLTTYYVTTNRIMKIYRFLHLHRKQLQVDKVRAIEERKSFTETLVGLGNIRVVSGGGGQAVRLDIKNISNSRRFANELRHILN